jgi:dTDP-4-amino-4,6-dideoxygalactose transaminase
MKVPLLDLKQQNAALMPELREAFERVLASGQFILGSEVQNLERRVAGMLGVKHAIGVSSGTDAILLALMALDIRAGDEVICPSFTFFATGGCVARLGARPVFADSCPTDFNIDVADAAKRITARTKAIIPVHLFGQAAEMDEVMALAKEHNLPVIEDAAQALGAAYKGRPVGSIGDFATFSFFPSKNLGGFGDSGLLVTNDASLAERAVLLRTHGAKPKYFHKFVGGNFRIDPLQAALLSVKLDHLDEYTHRRCENARYYTAQLGSIAHNRLRIVLPTALPHNRHIWNQYTIRVIAGPDWSASAPPRDALRSFLSAREIGSEIYYPLPLHLQECFPPVEGERPALPVCESLAEECLSIPVFPELTREQQDTVVRAISDFSQIQQS